MDTNVKRGDIFYADLSPVVGSEQGGTRPVLIVQNDTGNRHSPTVIAAAITSQTGKARLPTHISLSGHDVGLSRDSIVLLEQIRTIDKRRLREHMGHADESVMNQVDSAIAVSFGLPNTTTRNKKLRPGDRAEFLPYFRGYLRKRAMPASILRSDSSFPSSAHSSVAPPGVDALPETATRSGQRMMEFFTPRSAATATSVS